MSDPQEPRDVFQVSAEVVTRLGQELITDRTQALLELVKNSYDAGADRVEVTIDSGHVTWIDPPPEPDEDRDDDEDQHDKDREASDDERAQSSHRPAAAGDLPGEDEDEDGDPPPRIPLTGLVEIADSGRGLDETAITQGWLTLSASPKRAEKRAGITPSGTRTPLGDKGLGRLGAQRLGDRLVLRTRPRLVKDGKVGDSAIGVEHRVSFRFSDFTADRMLGDVPIERSTEPLATIDEQWQPRTAWGTVIAVQGLHDPGEWDRTAIASQLSGVLNPYKRIPGFGVAVRVDGQPVELTRVTRPLRDSALSRWTVDYHDDRLTISGSIRRQWFRPNNRTDRDRMAVLLQASDGPQRLLEAIAKERGAGTFELSLGRAPWLLHLRREIRYAESELPGVDPATGRPVDCGPFHAELDGLSLNMGQATAGIDVTFGTQTEYRNLVRDFAGVSVYRDGFRVASGFDLLRLGETFTAGRSFYSMRPGNTLGFVEISAAANAQLEETTDREGFRQTPAYVRFEALLHVMRDEINLGLNAVGRGGGRLLKDDRRSTAGLDETGPTATEAAEHLGRQAAVLAASVSAASRTLGTSVADDDAASREAVGILDAAAGTLEEIARLGPLAQTLRDEMEDLGGQLEEAYETVAVGIVAEGLAHEMTQTLDRLAAATNDIRRRLTGSGPELRLCGLFVEQVNDAIRALRTQLRHLDPQLRYARARPRAFALSDVVLDVMAYHEERLRDAIDVEVDVTEDAQLRAMPGRISQVLDNLALNSEHWVREAIRRGSAERGRIDVLIDGPLLAFVDNGVGIRLDLRASIFDPFVSSRRGGRGLGLYVCRQLLDRDGATIELADPQPPVGAEFRINLTAMLITEDQS